MLLWYYQINAGTAGTAAVLPVLPVPRY
eukprot:SAG31_NODE_613_length_13545_cov_10.972557_16_plen_27_part_01